MELKFYLKNALRSTRILSITFVIRIVSVVVGALSISAILSYVNSEFSTFRFLKNADSVYIPIYKEYEDSNWEGDVGIEQVRNGIPEIEAVTYVQQYSGSDVNVKYGDHSWAPNGLVVEQNFFEVLDFELLLGDKKTVFENPNSVLISSSLSRRIFGNNHPIGQELTIQTESFNDYVVKGTYELPSNSSMDFDFMVLDNPNDGGGVIGIEFVKLSGPINPEVNKKLNKALSNQTSQNDYLFDLLPIEEAHFDSRDIQFYRVIAKKGNLRQIYILIIICLIIGTVVMLNCSGLKFSEDFDQRKNLALKRVCGATIPHQLMHSLVNLVAELIIVLSIATIAILPLQRVFEYIFSFQIEQFEHFFISLTVSAFAILLIAFLGSSSIIYKVSYGKLGMNEALFKNKVLNRSWITISQFGLTIFLIICAVVVNQQYQSMIKKDLGFSYQNVLKTNLVNEKPWYFETKEERVAFTQQWTQNLQLLKNELNNNPKILSHTTGKVLSPYPMKYKRTDSEQEFEVGNTFTVSPGFDNTLELKVTEGRFFDPDRDLSRADKVVINQSAKVRFGIKDITTDKLTNASWGKEEIIGVVEDFHYEHLSRSIRPLVFYYHDDPEDGFMIKIVEGAEQDVIQSLSTLNEQINPGLAFDYSFLEDDIHALYVKEKKLGTIYVIFTVIICLISAMGLFAFAYRSIQYRIKEIGIRKVNGAKVTEVLALLNKDIIKWISVSFLLAAPLSWYFMDQWLKNFAFRITLDWWIFVGAGLFTLIIAVLTISYITWKAATRNPVGALRYE